MALPSELDHWIARLRLIPPQHRSFTVDPQRARLEFGVDDELAQQLEEHGLPCEASPDGLWFNETDLHYIGLRTGWATVYLQAMRQWATTLVRWSDCERIETKVRCVPYGPPGSAFEVVVAPDRRSLVHTGADRVATTLTASTRGRWPEVDPALHELFGELASLDFCRLPQSLHTDFDFVRRTGLADCTLTSLLLVEECERRGVAARTAFGLLTVTPYSTPHSWAELRIEDCWVPVDPLLLQSLVTYSSLDPAEWPPWRSPGAILMRLAPAETALVLADGEPVQATFLTKIHATPSADEVYSTA
jgi:hypothetical protein